jgi:hypothetical protein
MQTRQILCYLLVFSIAYFESQHDLCARAQLIEAAWHSADGASAARSFSARTVRMTQTRYISNEEIVTSRATCGARVGA